ncbi:hypothetical protein J6590_036364 [Homalodisca vitripennis]|nr:hypothetical protein J6590_036364 [Homalodisca vitripennis]
MKINIGIIFDNMYRNYPERDAVGFYNFLSPHLLLRSPDLIRKVLVSDFSSFHDNEFTVSRTLEPHLYEHPFILRGEEWKSNRVKLSASMTSVRMKELFPLIKEIVPRLYSYLDNHLDADLDAALTAKLFNLDIISNAVFGISNSCFADSEAPFRKINEIMLKRLYHWKFVIIFFMPRVRNFFGLRFVPPTVTDFVENMVKEIMKYRLEHNMTRNDLFQYFMKKDTGSNLDEIMFYSMTFFLEGALASSVMASMAMFELAVNPQIQDTLHSELSLALQDKKELEYDIISDLPYLDKVLKETLRKYPTIPGYWKECTKTTTFEIEGRRVEIELGTSIVIPVQSIHHDPQYYPDPEVFDPERFSEENKAQRPSYTYVPFGEGPRMCPGMRFGLTQVKVLISSIVSKYRILRSSRTPDKLTFATVPFLTMPKEPIWIKIEKRE